MRKMPVLRFLTVVALASATLTPLARAGGDWNDAKVAWQPYDKALAEAKKQKKPICLVFYTEWCPHCANYSGVFHDPRVIEKTKKLVMVRVDKDKNAELSKQFAPDGQYIPRTFFLGSDGKLSEDIHAPRDKFKYFYDEKDPAAVLAGMDEALRKLK